MEKPAHTQFPIHELLARRWIPHAFDERPIGADLLRTLFEAARWAPSSDNEQPWRFVVANEDETDWNRLFDCLTEAVLPGAAAGTWITAPESPADRRIDICRAMGKSHRITGLPTLFVTACREIAESPGGARGGARGEADLKQSVDRPSGESARRHAAQLHVGESQRRIHNCSRSAHE